MAGTSGQVVTIVGQDGDRVTISLPLAGFPDWWRPRPGDQAVLTQGDDGPVLRPLARVVPLDRVEARGAELRAATGEALAVQDATVYAEGQTDEHLAFTVPNDRGEPEQVLSIRRPR